MAADASFLKTALAPKALAENVSGASQVGERALLSRGVSDDAIYAMVVRELELKSQRGGTIIDVGCGTGHLFSLVRHLFDHYLGVDLVRYDSFPPDAQFIEANLEASVPLSDGLAEVVVSVETIEHLENPRAFVRELTRITKPGGWLFVTTPNQLSLLSKLSLVVKSQFPAFQEAPGLYPTHITALLESDLTRIAGEVGLSAVATRYSNCGRIPWTSWHWPTRFDGRTFSDNVMLIGEKPSR